MALTPDEELISFLKDTSSDKIVRNTALHYILGLTADEKGIEHLLKHKKYLAALCCAANEEDDIGTNACKCIINISSYEPGASALTTMDEISFFQWLVDGLSVDAPFVQLKCYIMSNISQYSHIGEELGLWFLTNMHSFKKLINLFCSQDSSLTEKYSSLALIFSNLTQVPSGQRLFLSEDNSFVKNLLPYTTCMDSETRRIGVVRALRNCCFSIDHHMWLLKEIEILPALLLPLAGPEEFDDEENEKLPPELQYLEAEKKREPNPTIRKLLIESVTKLCATKQGRMFIKDGGTYLVMRELHKWESDEGVIAACENLVNILVGDEPATGMENLMEVKIPEEVEHEFRKQDEDFPEADIEALVIS